jgi:Flp pilus assembly protein TadD
VHYRNLARLESAAEARIVIYQRGLKAVPADPELSRLLAEDFQRAKRHEEAIRLYERLVTANPKLQAETNDLAALLLDHRTDKASFERALELARSFAGSQNPLALDTLGWAYYRTGDFAQATRTLEQAVAGNGELPVLRYHLGMAYLAMGNKAGARAELAKAVAAPKADFTGLDNARNALANIN